MKYRVTDADVAPYLQELKTFIYTLGNSSSTGTDNLRILAIYINSNIYDAVQRNKEQLSFLSTRYDRVNATLSALENASQKDNNLDARYAFHKSSQNSLNNDSLYMQIVNAYFDVDLGAYAKQIAEFRRELASLTLLITKIEENILNLEDFQTDLPTLIVLCGTT